MTAMNVPNYFFESSNVYQLLSRFMFTPTADVAKALLDGAVMDDAILSLEGLGFDDTEIENLVSGLNPEVYGDVSQKEFFSLVRRDYTHLFSNPSFSTVLTRESAYREKAMGISAKMETGMSAYLDTRKRYETIRFSPVQGKGEYADHMGLELQYMQAIREEQGIALRENDEKEYSIASRLAGEFLDLHLKIWGIHFFNKVLDDAQEDVYRSIGKLGIAFLKKELGSA